MSSAISPIRIPQQPDIVSRNGASSGLESQSDFMETLSDAMRQVDGLQSNANEQVSNLLQGNGQDVHSALIAVERADIAFQLMMQVRNKIVNAYQEISRMQF